MIAKTLARGILLAALALAAALNAKAQDATSGASEEGDWSASPAPSLALARETQARAKAAFDAGDYEGASALAREAKAILAALPAGDVLPAAYVVRLIPEARDCLWRIAGYPFVYGDPWKWRLLWDANRGVLVDPENPDLLKPGQVLAIPSLGGERREGTWKGSD